MLSPSRNTSARKPSHLGSKSQPSPAGSSVASLASMGSIGGSMTNPVGGKRYSSTRSGTSASRRAFITGSKIPQGPRHRHPRRAHGGEHAPQEAHEQREKDPYDQERRRHLERESQMGESLEVQRARGQAVDGEHGHAPHDRPDER